MRLQMAPTTARTSSASAQSTRTRDSLIPEYSDTRRRLMKLVQSLIVAALVAVPVVSFAQSQPQQALTRAEVRAELVQLEKAGYNPSSDNTQYPQNIEAAEARISAGHGT